MICFGSHMMFCLRVNMILPYSSDFLSRCAWTLGYPTFHQPLALKHHDGRTQVCLKSKVPAALLSDTYAVLALRWRAWWSFRLGEDLHQIPHCPLEGQATWLSQAMGCNHSDAATVFQHYYGLYYSIYIYIICKVNKYIYLFLFIFTILGLYFKNI